MEHGDHVVVDVERGQITFRVSKRVDEKQAAVTRRK